MVLDWLMAQCSTGGWRKIYWNISNILCREFLTPEIRLEIKYVYFGESGFGDILRPNFDWRLFWEVDEGARALGENPKGFKCEQISKIILNLLQNTKEKQNFPPKSG